jgi:CHAT domain-containing protein
MIRHLILTPLTYGLLALLSPQVCAQTDDPQAEARRLNSRCLEFYNAGKFDEALEPCQLALAIREKAVGSEQSDLATSLNNLGLLYDSKGEYAKAEPLYERALAIYEKVFGGEHPLVATALNNLATLYRAKGEYTKAESLYQRALAIVEKASGSEHPNVATFLNNLAELYRTKGEYAKAEPLLQRALSINEKALGREHPNVATSLYYLARIYRAKGEYTKAESLSQRALSIDEKALGSKHPEVAADLNNLAELYYTKREYAKAEPLYERALAIVEKALGSEHPIVATSLNNLASLYSARGEYAKAEPLYQRALTIYERALGSEHPDLAANLNNLAELYYTKGEYAKAEPLYQRALAIAEKALGSDHPGVATFLNNLALLYEAEQDYPRAIKFLMRDQEIRESNINTILTTGSEKQKQLYLNTLSAETDTTVSLHAQSAPANAQAARLALTTILRRKGRALDVMTDQIAGLRLRAAPDDVKLLDALAAVQSQFANLQLSNDTRLSPAERQKRVTELETEIEKLQGDIGRRNAEFRAHTVAVTLEAVRGAIPTDAALVEMLVYRPYNAKARSDGKHYGDARYVAYVLKPTSEEPQFVDLGKAAQIDAELKLWREALLDPERTDVRQLGRRVDERVMRPVRKLLGDTKRLFISPDGALNLIPFAALVDENNKYLMETYSLDYLTSGRDLLRLQVRSENRSGAAIFANPTYNLTGQLIAACSRRKTRRGLLLGREDTDATNDTNTNGQRDAEYSRIDFTQLCYPPLVGTGEEATSLSAVLPNTTLLTDKRATEGALKALNAPSILHIATHGFFLADQPQSVVTNGRQLERPDAASVSQQENPMLRSGLILAGVNQKQSGAGEDGVLTAQEAAGLNLFGTKLVVLSACETGLGDVQNGAGVYGLRRALVLAGSETQVMSLWQVSDTATRDLMIGYYTRLQAGAGRIAAMHQVQLAMLHGTIRAKGGDAKADWRHPYYWAAFIPSGAWTTLDGQELK